MAGLLNRLAANPWMQAGQGMSAAQGTNMPQRLSSGLGIGINNAARYQQQQQEAKAKQLQMSVQQQQLYDQLYQNAQREAQQEHNENYLRSLAPNEQAAARAVGVGEYAKLSIEEQLKMNEVETYMTPQGPKELPKWQGQGRYIPYSVHLESEQNERAQRSAQLAEGRYNAEMKEDRLEEEAAQVEQSDALNSAYQNLQNEVYKATNALETVDKALDMTDNFFASGMASNLVPDGMAGTSEQAIRGYIETIQSTIGLDYLIEVKEKGATFGALSNQELALLVGNIQALKPELPTPVLQENLRKIREHLERARGVSEKDIRRIRTQILGSGNSAGGTVEGFEYLGTID